MLPIVAALVVRVGGSVYLCRDVYGECVARSRREFGKEDWIFFAVGVVVSSSRIW